MAAHIYSAIQRYRKALIQAGGEDMTTRSIAVSTTRSRRCASAPCRTLAAVALAAAFPVTVFAQPAEAAFPVKPIRIIVPLAPGGGNDAIARMVGARLQERLGQSMVVDNRPGTGGIVGTEIAARAAPDGYTMIVVNNSHVALSALYPKLSFDPVRDFAPVSLAASSPLLLTVNPSFPASTFAEFLAWVRANPGKLNYGTSGVGSPPHLAGELLAQLSKTEMTAIAFKGIGPAITAVLGNEIPMTFPNLLVGGPQVKAGKLRALAITSAKRSDVFPDLPTVAEAGLPGYESSIWFGFLAPAATPKVLIDRLNREIVAVIRLPEVRQQIVGIGAEPIGSTVPEFVAVMKNDSERLGRLIRERGIKAD
jgi:tripartite-type tricarboxylate transporter receptor subunit TctC